jgi:predicted ester cyclase
MDTTAIVAPLGGAERTPASTAPGEETMTTAQTTTAPSTAKAVVAQFYEDFDRGALGEFEAVDEAFAATVFGTTVLDWPGFIAFSQSFVDAFSDGRHEFDFVVADGDTVATMGHYRGHHDGELMGVAATGNEVDFTVMHIDRVQDGRIVEHRGIGDINAMWAQLGVSPPAR